MTINPVDIFISLIWTYFILSGFKAGFITQFAQILSLICGFIFANIFHLQAYDFLTPYIESSNIKYFISYIFIFLIAVFLIQLVAKIINQIFKLILLGWLNRILGLLLGGIKGLFLTSLFIFALEILPGTNELREKLRQESILYEISNSLKNWTINTLSQEELMYEIKQEIEEKTEEEYIQDLIKNTLN